MIQESIHQHWCSHTTDYNTVFKKIKNFDDQMVAASIIGKDDTDNYNTVSQNITKGDEMMVTVSNTEEFDIDNYNIVFVNRYLSDFFFKIRFSTCVTPWMNMTCTSSRRSTKRS